ncbi:MAG: prolyl oligopeptidase family serine peptidase [Chitinophagaceae bacterium]
MVRKVLLWMLAAGAGLAGVAQQTAQKFVVETQYLLYLPNHYADDTLQRWPLMVFLHGAGERGNDVEKLKANGPPMLAAQGKQFPFIIVSPQARENTTWKPDQLVTLLDDIKSSYRVDADRVYLTGLSMGGFGTWDLAMKFPERFAAIAPVCGGGDTTTVRTLRHMPVWCFHGAKDDVVPLWNSENMVNALRRYNPSVRFTVYPDANHDSWTATYNNDSLYSWLLAQRRFRYQAVTVDVAALKEYAGQYLSPERDTLTVFVQGERILIKSGYEVFELKPAARDLFFIKEEMPEDIRFVKSRKGVVDRFIFSGKQRFECIKIIPAQ